MAITSENIIVNESNINFFKVIYKVNNIFDFNPFDIKHIYSYFKQIDDYAVIDQDFLVSKVDDIDRYICPICLCLLNNPHTLNCRHVFCIKCLQSLRTTNCPICRTKYYNLVEESKLKDEINNFLILCNKCNITHTIVGGDCKQYIYLCNKYVTQPNFFNHLKNECGSDKTGIIDICEFCNEIFRKENLKQHSIECPKKLIQCIYCNSYIGQGVIANHINNHLIKCETCKGTFKAIIIEEHRLKCVPKQFKDNKNISKVRQINTSNPKLDDMKDRLRKKLAAKKSKIY